MRAAILFFSIFFVNNTIVVKDLSPMAYSYMLEMQINETVDKTLTNVQIDIDFAHNALDIVFRKPGGQHSLMFSGHNFSMFDKLCPQPNDRTTQRFKKEDYTIIINLLCQVEPWWHSMLTYFSTLVSTGLVIGCCCCCGKWYLSSRNRVTPAQGEVELQEER